MTEFYLQIKTKDGACLCTQLANGTIDFYNGNIQIKNISPIQLHTYGKINTLHLLDKYKRKTICSFDIETKITISDTSDIYISDLTLNVHKMHELKIGRLLEW